MTKSTNRGDYEQAPQPLGAMPKDYPDGYLVEWHSHERGQLIHAVSGVMKVQTATGLWLVPPDHALWMPPNAVHNMLACGHVALRTLYVHPDLLPSLPDQPKAMGVTPLLRELLIRAASIPINYSPSSHDAQLLEVLLGEVKRSSETIDFHLRPARDKRLVKVCDALIAHPGDAREQTEWASMAGCSSRTLARLFLEEFGLNFNAWRQQVRLMAAFPRFAKGEAVTVVALDLGYVSPGAFTEMFTGGLAHLRLTTSAKNERLLTSCPFCRRSCP